MNNTRMIRTLLNIRPGIVLFTLLWCWSAAISADELYFVHTDHLGTPRVITDANQQTVWEGKQLPFGETDISTSQIEYNLRFPGQYYDQESGLHYNYFRDYDPSIGRYIQSDPIGLIWDYTEPQIMILVQQGIVQPITAFDRSNHLYGYVEQNPIIWVDQTGLACFDSACIQRAKALNSSSQLIAKGSNIRKVRQLCEKWGGKPKEWKKKKGWDNEGQEWHWYELKGKKYGMKRAGEADPF